jgi:hypothetical protein
MAGQERRDEERWLCRDNQEENAFLEEETAVAMEEGLEENAKPKMTALGEWFGSVRLSGLARCWFVALRTATIAVVNVQVANDKARDRERGRGWMDGSKGCQSINDDGLIIRFFVGRAGLVTDTRVSHSILSIVHSGRFTDDTLIEAMA